MRARGDQPIHIHYHGRFLRVLSSKVLKHPPKSAKQYYITIVCRCHMLMMMSGLDPEGQALTQGIEEQEEMASRRIRFINVLL
jgi:hypothetical protein